jgi:hypothetical protein
MRPLCARVNDFAKSVGKAVQVRKDVDNLGTGDLSTAKPASFAFVKDWEAGNTLNSYEVAVGQLFKGALVPSQQMDVPYALIPYARFVGQINSDPKKNDIDNVAFGLRGDLYAIPLFGLENRFSLRGEYLTDSVAEASIAAGEFVWEPRPPFDPAFPHPFGHPQYYFGSNGPYIKLDLTDTGLAHLMGHRLHQSPSHPGTPIGFEWFGKDAHLCARQTLEDWPR